jgi:hypothetical protein
MFPVMKVIGYLTVTILLLGLMSGCAAKSKVSVTLNELISNPGQYNNQTVTVDGIYLNGWERTVLAEDIKFTGSNDPQELSAAGNAIWFAGMIPLKIRDKLYAHTSLEAGPQHYGKIRVTGLFETEGKYGYLSQYKYRITAAKVELLDWTPPE